MRRVVVTIGLVLAASAAAGGRGQTPRATPDGPTPTSRTPSAAPDDRALRELEQSAEADEAVLRRGGSDAELVLPRLARTYALLADMPRLRSALDRLERVAPERIRGDRELLYLAADVADRSGSREEAAAALLRFVNVFPQDGRRSEVLLRAARAFENQGEREVALQLTDEALKGAPRPATATAGQMGRAELLERIGRRAEARDEFNRVFEEAPDWDTAARALGRTIDLTIEMEGRMSALLLLAGKIQARTPFAAGVGRPLFLSLVAGLTDDLQGDPLRAAFVDELARRVGLDLVAPPALALQAAGLRERVGAYESAAVRYAPLAALRDPEGRAARAGLARCRPREFPKDTTPDPERAAALAREEAWPVVFRAAMRSDAAGRREEGLRLVGARAAFMVHEAAAAATLLTPVQNAGGSAALMRGDARALAGDWSAACRDYRAAQGPGLLTAEDLWLAVRLAACAARSGRPSEARARAQALLDRAPDEPAALAAEMLLSARQRSARRTGPRAGGAGAAEMTP